MHKEVITIDKLLKFLSSLIYRLILILYSIFILLRSDNYFNWYIYLALIIVYIGGYTYLFGVEKLSKVRLLLDGVLIGFVLYDKNLDDLVTIAYLLLPIFNAPNFSSKKRSYLLLYLMTMIIYIGISRELKWGIAVPFASFFVLSYIEYCRSRALNFYYNLNTTVLNLHGSQKRFEKSDEVYNDIISRFNNSKFSSVFTIDRIIYLSRQGKNFFIKNSSTFVSTLEMDPFDESKLIVSRLKITVDGQVYNNAIVVPVIENNNNSFYFILVVNYTTHLANVLYHIRDKYYLAPCLVPFFKQLSIFFETEDLIRKDAMKMFNKVEKEYEYVLRTINVVHFMRNRLTPFLNYLEMTRDIADYTTVATTPPEELDRMRKLISQENERSRSTLNEVLSRINQILDASGNPFNVSSDIKKTKINVLFSRTRNLLAEIIGSSDLSSDLSLDDFNQEVLVSYKGIGILFSDLINNIKKYGTGESHFFFSRHDNFLLISFENSFPEATKAEVKTFVSYLNSEEKNNIFKMSTKGAFLIKDFIRQMDIKLEADIDESRSSLRIILKFKISI